MSGMTDVEHWIYLDGPEPEPVRSILDSVRDLGPATPEDVERHVQMVALALGGSERREERGSDVGPLRESGIQVRSGSVEPAERDALPPPPPAPEPAPTPEPTPAAPSPLAGTADMDLSKLLPPALPFVPDSPGRVKARHTLHSEVARDPRLAQTANLGEGLLSALVPLVPFPGSTVGQGVVPFPSIDLEKYASLRAELTVVAAGKPREELLTRYHVVSEASLGALDAHWAERLARDAEERARYDALLARYTHWVRDVRPNGR